MKYAKTVLGLGFGDEGKGKVVSHLCHNEPNTLVIRFSGGHQAGHHVMLKNGKDHIFTNLGSGTLQGADTYWTKFCTVEPIGLIKELDLLEKNGVTDFRLLIDVRCPVVTPMDIRANIAEDAALRHGTCGVGFGTTLQREKDHYSLLVGDLENDSVAQIKVDVISRYYNYLMATEYFWAAVRKMLHHERISFVSGRPSAAEYVQLIHEGSQGLLLDKDIGFFPHVTRSSVGTANVEVIGNTDWYFVTRAYATRHGYGPFLHEKVEFGVKENPYETNLDGGYQGKFRKAPLDLDLLKYGIDRDGRIERLPHKALVITCLDLMTKWTYFWQGEQVSWESEPDFVRGIQAALGMSKVYMSHTPFPEDMELFE